MIEINLVPDVKQALIKAERIRTTVITFSILAGLASVAIVALLASYVYLIQSVRSGLDDAAITSSSKQLESVKDLAKTLTIQNQLTQIDELNSQKNVDSRLFDMLQAIIPSGTDAVAVSALSLDAPSTTITLQGQAPNGYAAVEVFKKTILAAQVNFTNDNIAQQAALASNLNLSNTSYGQDATGTQVLRFTISFTYDTDLFSPASTNVSVTVPNIGDATDSYLGVPKSIFAAPATDIKVGT